MTKLERVYDSIIDRIESGILRAGDQLPSEERLAASYRVSVGTVQKALSHLAHSGLVSREHGRGTFVAGSRVGPADINYLRFRDAEGRDLPHYVTVRSVRRSKGKGPWADFLGAGAHVRIDRLMNVGGRISLHSEFWLREAEFRRLESGLDGRDRKFLEKNLRVTIARQLSLPTQRIDQLIRFEKAPAAIARHIGLKEAEPAFVMEMRGYTLRDQPLFYQRVYAAPFSENLIIVR